ncbi:MAG: class I SAM-dependent rRNA methyltransferase [Chloroflexi bacterium]|nr:class I SAM-dependent rRNA methyltransferase [Chloroflexota bacterium]
MDNKQSLLSNLQSPVSNRRIAIHVTPAAERSIRSGHPWVFENSIQKQSFAGRPGDLAVLFDRKRRFLAVGLYDPTSSIRVRILQAGKQATIDAAWLQERLAVAAAIRRPLRHTDTTGYRLVHGENDGLPGLIIDRYGETYVIKLYTPAWIPWLADVVGGLTANAEPERIILRLSRALQRQDEWLYGRQDGQTLLGEPPTAPILFRENGLTFEADVLRGQKTGFFLDQRDNRARVEALTEGKSVLNVFAYTGGFSVYAALGGASRVTSLDISPGALAAAKRNFTHNQADPQVAACQHKTWSGDAFQGLVEMAAQGRTFDMVILDPPSFAKKQAEVEQALGAYGRLVKLALGVLNEEGILVAASCSSRVSSDEFFRVVHQTARLARRPLREIERTGHPLDHPVTYPEGAYLKCLFTVTP